MILSKIVHFSSVSCATFACTRLLWLNNFSLERVQLDTLVIHAQSAAMLPMALILLIASIKPEITKNIEGLNAHYLVAAISLAYISVDSLQL
ncbi:hypothetical protein [Photobacterium lucens]|uniref:hypothetical protein n=1 Tax=Photobacterium lucens TaxID=2562949 RepID=UPI0013698C72|nr:hypothetical protein [Photobacterium lucens]MBP2699972.1 hypothetical protein [Vibrio parahaemolyticus]MZG58625.1 hypothetical protein [Photobacterium lucens]MZG80672.1 hypothetical protein [Photobacterium lucens]